MWRDVMRRGEMCCTELWRGAIRFSALWTVEALWPCGAVRCDKSTVVVQSCLGF